MFCRTRILQRMVDVCFAVAIARPELAHYSRLHKLWPSNFGRGMLRGETVPRSIERYRTIIEVNRVAIVETAPEKVFCGMCAALKKVMPCDRAGLTVYDPEHDALKIAALYGRYENSFFHVGDFLRRNDSQNGWTFEHQSRTLRRDLAKEHQFALEKHTLEEGFQSLCSVPLVVYGKGVGVVTILSQQKNQYSHRDGEYLQDVANQIALLVAMLAPHCTHHPQSKLVCPRCIASAGGRTTTAKYKEQLSAWGQKGGVVRKKVVSSPDCRRPPGWRCCNAWCYSTEILRSAVAGVEADARTTADQDFPDTTGHSSSEPIFAQTSRQVSPQLC